MVLVGVVAFIGGGLLLAPQVADWMSYPDRVVYIQLFLLIVAFDALSAIPLARLRLEQRPWFFAAVNLANIAVNIVLIYALLKFIPDWIESGRDFSWYDEHYKISYYFLAILVAAAIKFFLLIGDRWWRDYKGEELHPDSDRRAKPSQKAVLDETPAQAPNNAAPTWKTMLVYAAPLVVVAVCGIVNTLVGPTMLKNYSGGSITDNLYWSGQYAAAMKLAVFLTLFTTAYNFAAEPFFFRQSGKDPKRADLMIYANASRAFALVTSLAIAGIMLLLPILQFYLGRNLREGLEVLPILLAANFMLGLYYSFAMAYKLTDKTYLGGLIALVGAAIVLAGNILFIDDYGIFAPAWAGFACFFVMSLLAYLVSRRHFPVPYPIGRFVLYALATAAVVYLGGGWESIWARIALLLVYTAGMIGLEWKWLRGLV
jgi:O-antigen/teichoic acid export membrane protein